MEICCESLRPELLAAEVAELVRVIQERGRGDLDLMHGFAYDVENQWEWFSLPASGFSAFLEASARKGIYGHGQGDLYVKIPSAGVEVTLCHESDIHIAGDGKGFLDYFRTRWLGQGIKVWLRRQDGAHWVEANLVDQS
jgi:hypothetical protein